MAGFSILQEAAIPFNGSGSFSLAEPPFVPLTTISSATMNSDLADIADGLSTCLTTDGQSSMSAQLKAFGGTVTNPGYTFANDLNTGVYRIGSDNIGMACGGTKILDVASDGISVTGDIDASGLIKQNGMALLPVGIGPLPWAGETAPDGWLLCYGQSLLRSSYSALFAAIGTAYGAADSTHFNLPDMRGRISAGKDDMGGVAANRLTSTTMTPDGVTLGATGGSQTVTLSTAQIPAHTHAVVDPGHAHANLSGSTTSSSSSTNVRGGGSGEGTTSVNPTNITISNTGGGEAHGNIQPSIITNYIIFAGV